MTRVMQTIANRAQEERKISSEVLALVKKYEDKIATWVDRLLVKFVKI
jgi:hypothetical protein